MTTQINPLLPFAKMVDTMLGLGEQDRKTTRRSLTGKISLRRDVPPGVSELALFMRDALAKGMHQKPKIALADGPDPAVTCAALTMATYGLAGFVLFAGTDDLETNLPKINAQLKGPINEPFGITLGDQLGVDYTQLSRGFSSLDDLLKRFEVLGIEVIDPATLIEGKLQDWQGFRDALIGRLKSCSKRPLSEAEYLKRADSMMENAAAFAVSAAAIGWKGVTNAVGGKKHPTAHIARYARKVELPPGMIMTSFGTAYRADPELWQQPDVLLMADPAVLPDPDAAIRVSLMLALAQMLEDAALVKTARGARSARQCVCADSFSTNGSADPSLVHEQRTVAERSANLLTELKRRRGYWSESVMLMPEEAQLDAVLFLDLDGNPSKLRREDGGGQGAGIVFPDLTAGNNALKLLSRAIDFTHGGGPIFLAVNPDDPIEYRFFRTTDLSRSDDFLRILCAMFEAVARPMVRIEAEEILKHKMAA